MILADTSVWITYLRSRSGVLDDWFRSGLLRSHPVMLGELIVGGVTPRHHIWRFLSKLEDVEIASHFETVQFIWTKGLVGSGIGYSDAQLLASVLLTQGARLATLDRRLATAAQRLGVLQPLNI